MAKAPSDIIRVGIVEDNERELATLEEVLGRSRGFSVVGVHRRPESAWGTLRSEKPDMLLLDLVFADGELSGHDLLLRLRGESDPPSVVVWTVRDDEGHFLAALEAGACGYLLKTTPLAQLPDALRAIYHGELRVSSGVARLLLREFREPQAGARGAPAPSLGPREEQALELLAAGYTRTEIAGKLGISLRTVEYHLASVRRKLAARTLPHAVALFKARGR